MLPQKKAKTKAQGEPKEAAQEPSNEVLAAEIRDIVAGVNVQEFSLKDLMARLGAPCMGLGFRVSNRTAAVLQFLDVSFVTSFAALHVGFHSRKMHMPPCILQCQRAGIIWVMASRSLLQERCEN